MVGQPFHRQHAAKILGEQAEQLRMVQFAQHVHLPFRIAGKGRLTPAKTARMTFDGTQLTVTQSRKNLDRVKNIIRRYSDIKQVHIEAKFIEVEQKALNELGVNWTLAPTAGGPVKPSAQDTLHGVVYADNWFMLYINGELVAVDSIKFTPHNVVSVDILPEFPMTIAVMAKDNADLVKKGGAYARLNAVTEGAV